MVLHYLVINLKQFILLGGNKFINKVKNMKNDEKITISNLCDSDRIGMIIDELKTYKYFYGNEMGDVGNVIGYIMYKYLTDEYTIDVFIDGILQAISVEEKIKNDEKVTISKLNDYDRIEMFINELKAHQYLDINKIGDISNQIGHIIYKYLTEFDDIETFIGGLLHAISVEDGSHP